MKEKEVEKERTRLKKRKRDRESKKKKVKKIREMKEKNDGTKSVLFASKTKCKRRWSST